MVVRMRHTRAHTANRRSHHALKALNIVACKDCGAMKTPHTVCDACGMYRGKKILATKAVKTKDTKKS